MVLALALVFFTFELPYQISNVVAMTTGYYSYTDRAAFILEILAQANVLHAPWIYLFLNTSYRNVLKQILTDSSGQTTACSRGTPPIRNQGQRVAATNRNPENKRVMLANRRVDPLPQPVGLTTKQTNGDKQVDDSKATTSKTMECSFRRGTSLY